MANEKIEVGYRHIGSLGVDYHHKFLLYTDKTGKQYTIRDLCKKVFPPTAET